MVGDFNFTNLDWDYHMYIGVHQEEILKALAEMYESLLDTCEMPDDWRYLMLFLYKKKATSKTLGPIDQ